MCANASSGMHVVDMIWVVVASSVHAWHCLLWPIINTTFTSGLTCARLTCASLASVLRMRSTIQSISRASTPGIGRRSYELVGEAALRKALAEMEASEVAIRADFEMQLRAAKEATAMASGNDE